MYGEIGQQLTAAKRTALDARQQFELSGTVAEALGRHTKLEHQTERQIRQRRAFLLAEQTDKYSQLLEFSHGGLGNGPG